MSEPSSDPGVWLDQVREEIIDPDRPIVDPHHHLWRHRGLPPYLLGDLWEDTGSGHNIEKTVFMECGAEYRTDGPERERSIGEIDFVVDAAEKSAADGAGRATIAALVSHVDLTDTDGLEALLQQHVEASRGLFRGIRHAGARDENPGVLMIPGRAPVGLYADTRFREGVKVLGRLGHSYDTWHYHHQNPAFEKLAQAVPDTIMVLDHFGTPLGVGAYANQREEIFEQWKKDVAQIARSENVFAKLGGLAMPDNGFGWMGRDLPPTSDEFVAAQSRYYLHMIECFTPARCMFESNFPVDKFSLSYHVMWNGMKKIVQGFSEDEKDAMFRGTASKVYRLR
jgi:L-fuconolactonase